MDPDEVPDDVRDAFKRVVVGLLLACAVLLLLVLFELKDISEALGA